MSDQDQPAGRSMSEWMGRAVSIAWSLLDDVLVVVVVAVASFAFAPAYDDSSWRLPVLAAIVLAAVVGFFCGVLRAPYPLCAVVALVGLLFVSLWLLGSATGLPTVGDVSETVDKLVGGLGRLLTVAPPADATGALVALPVALAWFAAFAAAVLTVRGNTLAPLLPPLLLFVAGLLLTAEYAATRWVLTGVFLALVLLVVVLRADIRDGSLPDAAEVAANADAAREHAHEGRMRSRLGRLVIGVPVVAVVTVAGVLGAVVVPVASGASRFDVRDLHRQPVRVEQRVNPLSDVRRQVEEHPQDLFRVTLAKGSAPVDRIRVAALDDYDGSQWTSHGRYLPTGSTLPPGPRVLRPTLSRLGVEVLHANGPFLPVAGWPVQANGADLAFDSASGQLLSTAESATGATYATTVEVPPSSRALGNARTAAGTAAAPYLHLPAEPPLPPDAPQTERLGELAAKLTANASTPVQRLDALVEYLRQRPYDLSAPPGQSYAALDRVLDHTPRADQGVTEEQTASAFSVMARTLGYPARVAVGYQLDQKDIAAGTFTVTTRRAYAWPEVLFDGVGWVPFDPTGQRRSAVPEQAQKQTDDRPGKAPDVKAAPVQQSARSGDTGPEARFGGGLQGRFVLWVVIAVLAVLLTLGAVVGAKLWRRQRRRTRGAPADRITAAWHESTDRLREHGLPVSLAATHDEVATAVNGRFGTSTGGAVAVLAPLVSTAVFGPDEPVDEDVDRAWDLERELRGLLDGDQAWFVRARAWVDPRPLLPRRKPVVGDDEWRGDASEEAGR
jgi:transglutaminase-like putative cysteine protease